MSLIESDAWMGDDDHVRGTFPGLKKDRTRHEHRHIEGGLFYHSHARGATPHVHGPRGGFRRLTEPTEARGQ